MQTKDFNLKVNQLDDGDAPGTFTGWGSVYDVTDLGGDIVMPGAFTKMLQSSATLPLLWQHNTAQPIGIVTATDTARGLAVQGQLLMRLQQAKDAYALLKAGVIKGL